MDDSKCSYSCNRSFWTDSSIFCWRVCIEKRLGDDKINKLDNHYLFEENNDEDVDDDGKEQIKSLCSIHLLGKWFEPLQLTKSRLPLHFDEKFFRRVVKTFQFIIWSCSFYGPHESLFRLVRKVSTYWRYWEENSF